MPGPSPLDNIDLLVNTTTSWQGMNHVVEGASPGPDHIQGLTRTEQNALPLFHIRKWLGILVFPYREEKQKTSSLI